MPSPSAGPDTPVIIKVNFDGRMCRLALPLKDMGAVTLEAKLRVCLKIDPSTECLIERYSDSASAFVVLDRSNTAVYKQLYRAAKAKQRLKIKVTTNSTKEVNKDQEQAAAAVAKDNKEEDKSNTAASAQVPRPVSVEDVPEESPAAGAAGPSQMKEISKMQPTAKLPKPLVIRPQVVPQVPAVAVATSATCTNAPIAPVSKASASTANCPPFPQCPPYPAALDDIDIGDLLDFTRAHTLSKPNPTTTTTPTMAKVPPYCPAPTSAMIAATTGPVTPTVPVSVAPVVDPTATTAAAVTTPMAHLQKALPQSTCSTSPVPVMDRARATFAVCCNSCDSTIPDAHYHCSTCDDGDFDLCPSCVDGGISCYVRDHWLIKRVIVNGQIINSTTQKIPTKPKGTTIKLAPVKPEMPAKTASLFTSTRTCNGCVKELAELDFVNCVACDDFDLCTRCFVGDKHGHDPAHGFTSINPAPPREVTIRLKPGRNQPHNAVCDGCEMPIKGVRNKCQTCPDFDYCLKCMGENKDSHPNHPGHRFAPIYTPLGKPVATASQNPVIHDGIFCDGEGCRGKQSYIRGDRFKCTACHDTDFCAACEASPKNAHKKNHPVIKFKTPVAHVTVTTTGDKYPGRPFPVMGDRPPAPAPVPTTNSRATSTSAVASNNSSTTIQTLVDVKPAEPAPIAKPEPVKVDLNHDDLQAVFVRDLINDGTVMAPNTVFSQTWTLRNDGAVAWPAGCFMKFAGGDYMGHVDPAHPAGVSDLVSANESTVCSLPLEPGREFSFTVLMRSPMREGKSISYWRLSTPDGFRFGHRIWCDVMVAPKIVEAEPEVQPEAETEKEHDDEAPPSESQMIFPKLDKESPVSSIHESHVKPEPVPVDSKKAEDQEQEDDEEEEEGDVEDVEDFAEYAEDEEWEEDESFLTDEEYDILDASDEEYLEEQQKKV